MITLSVIQSGLAACLVESNVKGVSFPEVVGPVDRHAAEIFPEAGGYRRLSQAFD